MTLVPLPFVQRYRSAGRVYAYYRRNGRRTRIKGAYNTPEWHADYQRIHAEAEAAQAAPAKCSPCSRPGSFQALADLYFASPGFRRLATKSQADYRRLLAPLLKQAGHHPVAKLPRAWVLDRLAELQDRPRTANYMLAVLRRVLAVAVEREWRSDNPALAVKLLPYRREPHRRWTDAEIAAFTSPAVAADLRLAIMLALYTGQRQGDALRLLWSAYQGGAVRLRQSKTGVELVIPVHAALRAELDAAPRTAAVICATTDGRAWGVDHFRHRFAATRAALGLSPTLTFHGLRASAASRLAEAGCSTEEIKAITGHLTDSMAAHYSRGARQEKLARSAMRRLGSV